MKKEQGITLISLVIYIIGMVIVIGITGTLLSFYNNNMVSMNDTSDVNMELTKLEQQMITETKAEGNKITSVSNTTIVFSSGNIYSYADNRIYQNTVPMVNYVKEFMASLETDGEKQILRLYVVISKGEAELVKNLTYVVEGATTITEVGKPEYVLEYDDTTDVYGNLYKISDTEYHLIFNTTGDIAEGYTESQLIVRGDNIKDGAGYIYIEETDSYISAQPWAPYSENITKVKIEEKIKPRSMGNYFFTLSKITEIENLNNIDTSNTTSMYATFQGCQSIISLDLSTFDTSKVTQMFVMFEDCSNLSYLNLSSFDTSDVLNMARMFAGCSKIENLDVSSFNTSSVTNMYSMFSGCSNLTSIDVKNWDTSKVTNMKTMFYQCSNLTSIDVKNWDTSNVTNMHAMFSMWNANTNLTSVDVSNWDTRNVTNMQDLFGYCTNLNDIDVSNFNTSNVTNMEGMFIKCTSLASIDVSNWDTSNVTNMQNMFRNCTNLKTIYAGEDWTTSSVITGNNTFGGCTSLKGVISYDSTKTDATYANWTTGYLTYVDIPIYTYAELLKMGSSENVTVSHTGKTYQFSQGKTYLIKNNIEFTGDYSAVATLIQNGKINVIGNNTITVTNSSGVKEYYTPNSKYYIATNKYGYVLAGLQVYYDGIDNTGYGHSSTTAVWKDLSGNNKDGTLKGRDTITSANWTSNGLIFDGSDDWVSIGEMNYEQVTVEMVVLNSEIKNEEIIYMCNYESGGYGIRYYLNNNVLYNSMQPYVVGTTSSYQSVFANNAVVANKKYSISGSYDGTTITLRENANTTTKGVTGTIGTPASNTILVIGANPGGSVAYGSYLKGTVYSARVYNRALTADEQETNYKADQARYGV